MKEIMTKISENSHNLLFSGLSSAKSNIRAEILAGLILAAIGIPEVMGYAKIAGMPVITGLYTILIPLAVFSIFCSSRHLVVGADSATAAILVSTLAPIVAIGSPDYIALVSTVAILCALFLFLARIFKLGFIADFMSRTVLVGFLTGVGVQIAISQVSSMIGLPGGGSGLDTIAQIINTLTYLPHISIPTIIISIIVISTILGFRYYSPKIPGALIAVIGTIVVSLFFNFESMGISIVGNVPTGLPTISIPPIIQVITFSNYQTIFLAVLTCFIVIIAQSAATSRAYAFRYSERLDEDKDFLGLAVANGAAGLTGTFVVNGSPTKTEIVDSAGSRSQLASLITAGIVLIVLVFLTKPISFLPNATLASIVFLIGLNMIDIKGLNDIRSKIKSEYYLALITAFTVIFFSVFWGIIISIILSVLLHISHSYNAVNSILIKDKKGKWIFNPVKYGETTKEGLIIYRFNRDLYYANSDLLRRQVIKLIKTAPKPIKWFVIDAGGFEAIDYTSAEMLKGLHDELRKKGVKLIISTHVPQLRDQMETLGLTEVLGEDNIYVSTHEALESFESNNS